METAFPTNKVHFLDAETPAQQECADKSGLLVGRMTALQPAILAAEVGCYDGGLQGGIAGGPGTTRLKLDQLGGIVADEKTAAAPPRNLRLAHLQIQGTGVARSIAIACWEQEPDAGALARTLSAQA
jgi:hypothetical protein